MMTVLGIEQGWWSVVGLAADILGFSLIAAELFLSTRLPLLSLLVASAEKEVLTNFQNEGLSKTPPTSVMDHARFDAWAMKTLDFFDRMEDRIVLRCLAEGRAKLGWFIPFDVKPQPDARHVIQSGALPDIEGRALFLISDRFRPSIEAVERWANSLRKLVPLAIILVIFGFFLQIIGSWPS